MARWLVTDMVKPRTLTSDFVTHFPCGYPDFAENQYCKQRVYFRQRPFSDVFGATKSYQILPIFTKSVQQTGSKRHLKGGFLRPIYLNRAKSGGSCQPVISAPFFQDRRKQHGGAQAARTEPGGGRHFVFWIFAGTARLRAWQPLARLLLGGEGAVIGLLGGPFGFRGVRSKALRGQSVDSTMVIRRIP